MASGKVSTRQKMINMMYLVLTAMLALNVSAEILKAFAMIENSLGTTNGVIDAKNAQVMDQFSKLASQQEKYKANYDKAVRVQELNRELLAVIANVKDQLIDAGGNKNGKNDELDYKVEGDGVRRLVGEGDIDISSRFLVGTKGTGSTALGDSLRNYIANTRAEITKILGADASKVKLYLEEPIDPPKEVGKPAKTWLQSNFGEMPLAGAITVLTKFEADVKNTETEVLNALLGAVDEESFKFDKLQASVIAPTSYVLQGQKYTAEVLLVAFDSRQNPDITVGGAKLQVVDGKGQYVGNTSSEGIKKWGGVIRVQKGEGFESYPFEAEYQVAKPSAVVSPDKMNVFYIGVDNPVSISAPGVPLDKVKLSMSSGTFTGSNGKYVVRQTTAGEVTVTVSAEIDGKSTVMGSSKFRVKIVPDPVAKAGNLKPGNIATNQFKVQPGILAVLENFDFDLKFNVQKFTVKYYKPRQDPLVRQNAGAAWSGEVDRIIKASSPGDTFIFDDITVKGPDGRDRIIPGISYTLR